MISVNLGRASLFMTFDKDENSLIVKKGALTSEHTGTYEVIIVVNGLD